MTTQTDRKALEAQQAKAFLQAYSDWLKSRTGDQAGTEHLTNFIAWIKSEPIAGVSEGYGYGCEISFDAQGNVPYVAFDAKLGRLSVFPYSDMSSPSFIWTDGDAAREAVQALNDLVKDHLGLV